ncbi:MAG: SPOR domain-containing protein [Phycisphaerae bacterium]|nr:SPOR domain-containing protein [Phycisphaerae bacterium]
MCRWLPGLGIVLVLPLASGCAELPASAWKDLTRAETEYRDSQYDAAAARLDIFLKTYPEHRDSAQAYYLRSLCRAKQSQKSRARADALSCIKLSHTQELSAKAHAMVGELLYEEGQAAEAIPHYAAALRGLPGATLREADVIRYHYGQCLQREGDWRGARLEFAAVYQRYPGSPCAEHAKRMYEWPYDYFSIQCGAYREKAGAGKLEAALKEAGLRARVETRPRGGELLHVVFVGRYPRYDQAQGAIAAVQRNVSDAIVVP